MKNIVDSSKPSKRDIFLYRQRQKNEIFQAVVGYFAAQSEELGLTKKEIAHRLDKDPSQITRWFSEAGNWELDTISDLLIAMGAEMKHTIVPIKNSKQDGNPVYIEKPSSQSTSASTGAFLRVV
jgi:hypothetical protein